jgi:Zn-dependent protease
MLLTRGNGPLDLIILIPAILLALTVHEFAHAWVAWKMGDNTARDLGRVSLNPFVHLDIMGTIVMVLTGFIGWAKPVPIDPRNFKNGVKDMALVAVAGPRANILTASLFIGTILIAFSNDAFVDRVIPDNIAIPLFSFIGRSLVLNIAFAFLNLIPVPPLDGFNVISMFLPPNAIMFCLRYRMFFMIALILFVWKGPFASILQSILNMVFRLFN